MSAPHLVIMAAGTGGHIIPGLAVAREVQQRGWSVSWLGTRTGMENRLVPAAGIALDTLDFSGLRGKGLAHSVGGALKMLKAGWDAAAVFRRRRATAVLGMGGYVCFPAGVVAHFKQLPLMLVNADAALLLSNKALLSYADRIAFGFDGAAARIPRGLVTGNPVRAEIEAIAAPERRYADRQGPLKLLVVGGSLGAQVLNRTLPQALALMPAEVRPQVVHQTGQAQLDETRAAYRKLGLIGEHHDGPVEVLPFIDDMAARLAACDLILCRAGAVTVSELCAAGVPALLVPLVIHTTAHQRDNAEYMAAHGAALHLPQAHISPASLADHLGRLQRPALLQMAQAARALAKPKAAQKVADVLAQLIAPPTQKNTP